MGAGGAIVFVAVEKPADEGAAGRAPLSGKTQKEIEVADEVRSAGQDCRQPVEREPSRRGEPPSDRAVRMSGQPRHGRSGALR